MNLAKRDDVFGARSYFLEQLAPDRLAVVFAGLDDAAREFVVP